MSQTEKVLREALEVLEAYASSQICTHDDTHRGGTLWEICDQCGAKWADDKGGKPRFKWPKEILAARAALYPPETQGEPVAGDSRVCHPPGDKCYGCPHYHGKASVCSYAPPSQPAQGVKVSPEGYNGAIAVAAAACAYLANHDRPGGGEQRYNAAHLYQISEELKRTIAMLAAAPAAPEAK